MMSNNIQQQNKNNITNKKGKVNNNMFKNTGEYVLANTINSLVTAMCFPNADLNKPRLVKLVNAEPLTIAFWSDGTETRATCLPDDKYSAKKGLLVCRMKKKHGSWTAYEDLKNKRKVLNLIELSLAQVINIPKEDKK